MKSAINNCPDCTLVEKDSYRSRAQLIRRELRRHHFTERERHLAEVILDLTFGWNRDTIAIPQLQCFSDLTGIGKTHVSEGISDLHLMKVIRVITEKGHPVYSIREDVESWKVKPRVSTQAMSNSINLVREWNGLEPLAAPLEAIANFKNQPHARKIRSCVPESGTPADVPVNLPLPHLF
jgi:hypothetical protein